MGLVGEFVAFAFLGADGEEADAGFIDSEGDAAIDAAEDRVVDEVFGASFGIRAGVDEDEVAFLVGDNGGEGGAVDAFEGAEFDGAAGHEAAGVSAAEDDVGLAGFDQLDGADHRGIFFPLDRLERFVVHGDDFGGVKDGNGAVFREAGAVEFRFEDRFVADEDDVVEAGDLLKRQFYCRNDFPGAEIASHRVHGDGRFWFA